jgi:acyl carrier protein
MERQQFLEMIEGILELQPRSLEGRERLADFEKWDSIAILDYMAMVDRSFGLILSVDEIAGCQTFDDLFFRLSPNFLQGSALQASPTT